MHVAQFDAGMFPMTIDGQEACLDDVFPGFDERDRLGIVVHSPFGGLGASSLILRCVNEYYRLLQGRGEVYPEYFVFSVGGRTGDHSMLDLWPPHRFVTLENDAERVLQAIADRGVTRLLVEDQETMDHEFAHWTKQSALQTIKSAVLFDASGTLEGGDVQIGHTQRVEAETAVQLDIEAIRSDSLEYPWYLTYLATWENDFSPEVMAELREARASTLVDGYRIETYARVSIEAALSRLATASNPDLTAFLP